MISQSILNEKIEAHEEWLLTEGVTGTQLILSNEIIEDLDFQEGNLKQSIFEFCNFKKCCFNNTNLEEGSIKSCQFENCSMEEVNFERSVILSNIFEENILNKSIFKGSLIIRNSFSKCYLNSCNFISDEPIPETPHQTTILINNSFLNSFLKSCQFNYSIFSLAIRFENCDLSSSIFDNVDFHYADFFGSCFNGCQIKETDFSFSNMTKTSFENVNMDDGSIWGFCIGNKKEILTIQSTLFNSINITKERIFFGDISDTKENWLKILTDEEVVAILETSTEESTKNVLKWWVIFKPLFISISNYNIDN